MSVTQAGATGTGNVRQLTDVPRVDGHQPHGMRSTDTDTLVVGGGEQAGRRRHPANG